MLQCDIMNTVADQFNQSLASLLLLDPLQEMLLITLFTVDIVFNLKFPLLKVIRVWCLLMAPKKSIQSPPLDPKKCVGINPQDPRSSTECWPCKGNRKPSNAGSNGFGAWKERKVCAVRTEYIPRQGYQGKARMQVTQALNRLEKDLKDSLPNADLVKLTINMIEKEERLISLKHQMARLQNEISGMHNNYLRAVQTGNSGSIPGEMMSPQSEAYSLVSSLTEEEVEELTRLKATRQVLTTPRLEDPEVELAGAHNFHVPQTPPRR